MTRLQERGHHVEVLCSDQRLPDRQDEASDHEGRVHRRLQLYMRDGQLWAPGLIRRAAVERANQNVLDDVLATVRPDVVSVWHVGALSVGVVTTLVERGLPIVYSLCDEWPAYMIKLDPWMRLFADRRRIAPVVHRITGLPTTLPDLDRSGPSCFISELTRSRVREYSRWEFSKSTVVYSGIDRRLFQARDSNRHEWDWRLLYVGRFDARKGTDTVLQALARLPEASLVMDGRGAPSEMARLEALASELGVDGRVRFQSSERAALPDVYRDADACIFASEWDEPFGLVPLEAMACGTPVVATGTGGSAEFLADGVNCVRFERGDPAALADAVVRLAADPGLRMKVVAAGRESAEFFDVEHLVDVFEAWHDAVANGYADGVPPDRPPPPFCPRPLEDVGG